MEHRPALIHWELAENPIPKLKVCAVSYLNTVPLVWGMLNGAQRAAFDLEFRIPAGCADRLASGAADIGIVPSFELTRQDLEILPGTGIACHGPVRSILLISGRPAAGIRTVAMDTSSRTSVQLARVILAARYGARPLCIPHEPNLEAMLRMADAALIIGDPALRIDPSSLPYHVYDLGAEWVEMTGLPMVFAVWAGRRDVVNGDVTEAFRESCRFGRQNLGEIVAAEAARRQFPQDLVREYLTTHIVHELGPDDYRGMRKFLEMASELSGSPDFRRTAV